MLFDTVRRQVDPRLARRARRSSGTSPTPSPGTCGSTTARPLPRRDGSRLRTSPSAAASTTWVDLAAGRIDPWRAVATGRMRPTGKLRLLLRAPKLFASRKLQRTPSGSLTTPIQTARHDLNRRAPESSPAARSRGLGLVSRANRWIATGAVLLTAAFSVAAAKEVHSTSSSSNSNSNSNSTTSSGSSDTSTTSSSKTSTSTSGDTASSTSSLQSPTQNPSSTSSSSTSGVVSGGS